MYYILCGGRTKKKNIYLIYIVFKYHLIRR
uniref:Uncharacterized protein n=1 Tax=Anguilla anguilla TaxID=7936 RepID=A0A0E9TBQ6_ANGAN